MQMSQQRRRLLAAVPESSAVAEQHQNQFGDTEALLAHHWAKVRGNNPGLGELPESFLLEQQARRIHNPGAGLVSDWTNRFTQSNFPFVIGLSSERVLPANPLRTYLLIQNKSLGNMFVNFGSGATAFNGVQIVTIGNYELIGGATGGCHCPGDDIYIVGDAAGLAGVITEGVMLAITPEGY